MSPAHNTDPVVYYALGDILERVCAIHSKLYELEYTQNKLDRKMSRICAHLGITHPEDEFGPSNPPEYASSPPRSPQLPPPPPARLQPLSALTSSPSSPTLPSTVPETEGSGFPDVTDPWQEESGENDHAA
ncbi:hypothetical protein AAP_06191 [Ascosphaera apis ARSEF 7405]|uniref:Uncharacterized protein n=1 Tax=Ascosphaera apis ARSEF 7405 TaxID=392613 RepID=A0A167UYU2_9EURO|nr:hypothetical protein AAP_06191 [Ascosphaera apis ARSEF 7405]